MKLLVRSRSSAILFLASLILLPSADASQYPDVVDGIDITNSAGTCGGGWPGNGICPDRNLCCSEYGWCNVGDAYCLPENRAPIALCELGDRGNGVCPNDLCCSENGYCGEGDEYCGYSGAPAPGPTDPVPPPPSPAPPPDGSQYPDIVDGIDITNRAGTCGGGWPGNGICQDRTLCCSENGWCNVGDDYCLPENRAPIALCELGDRGNGVCPNDLCCSENGYCGEGAAYCGSAPPGPTDPVPPPPSPAPPPATYAPFEQTASEHARMIAYVGNWMPCPSDTQIEEYTHVVISFAVSYQYQQWGNLCDPQCVIATPPTCDNQVRQDLIDKWRSMGKKVLLSFGGAGMGGSWATSNDDCWEYCYGREDYVVNRLAELNQEMNLDGIDLDYEYFYEDNQNGSGFSRGAEAQTFLREVTLGLRDALPPGAEITHAPMDNDARPGTGYFDVLRDVADALDFLMPQYYNGDLRPGTNFPAALDHFDAITDELFGGDATRVVFGFCIADCWSTGSNLDGPAAKNVMTQLADAHPCNGGAFFWYATDDPDGQWSSVVNEQLEIDAAREECVGTDDNDDVDDPSDPPSGSPTQCFDSEGELRIVHPSNGSIVVATCAQVAGAIASKGNNFGNAVCPVSLEDQSTLHDACRATCAPLGWGPCATSS